MRDDDVALIRDAARVHRVHRTVRDAVAALASRPLSEAAATQMRAALADINAARRSLDRLAAVSDSPEERYER